MNPHEVAGTGLRSLYRTHADPPARAIALVGVGRTAELNSELGREVS